MDQIIMMGIGMLMGVVGMIASSILKRKFAKYAEVPISAGLSGRDIAAKMLQHYGVNDVQIVESAGFLSDHYNPMTKVVALSPDVYHGRSVAAAAVAAHECGHAVQHATAYSMLQLRSAIVPVVNIAAGFQQYVLLAGFMMINTFPQLLLIGIILFAATAFFSLVTLPVEFDASNRALAWLDSSGTLGGVEHSGAKDALFWAAMTYVVAALSSVAQLVYLVFRYTQATRD